MLFRGSSAAEAESAESATLGRHVVKAGTKGHALKMVYYPCIMLFSCFCNQMTYNNIRLIEQNLTSWLITDSWM